MDSLNYAINPLCFWRIFVGLSICFVVKKIYQIMGLNNISYRKSHQKNGECDNQDGTMCCHSLLYDFTQGFLSKVAPPPLYALFTNLSAN